MDKITIVNKISEGLFESALTNNLVSAYKEDLKFIVFTLKNDKDLFSLLNSPFIDYKEKAKVTTQVFGKTLEADMIAFLNLIVEKELISYIDLFASHFESLANEKDNIITGIIYTPFLLDESQIKKLEKAFRNRLNKTVKLTQKEEKSLIAGIRVVINDYVYEYSINSKLEDVKQNLITRINKQYNETEEE